MDKAGSAPAVAGPAPAAGPAGRGPTWRFLITPRWLAWHAFAVAAFWGMCWLGDWQLRRALAGNGLSWAYTFEWPIFAVMGAIFWGKTIRDEFHVRRGGTVAGLGAGPAGADGPVVPGTATDSGRLTTTAGSMQEGDGEPEDPELAAYNQYLARLNAEVKDHGRWHGLR